MFIIGNRVKIKYSYLRLHPELKENVVYTIKHTIFNPFGNCTLYFLKNTGLIFHDEDLILLRKPKLELE